MGYAMFFTNTLVRNQAWGSDIVRFDNTTVLRERVKSSGKETVETWEQIDSKPQLCGMAARVSNRLDGNERATTELRNFMLFYLHFLNICESYVTLFKHESQVA